MENFFEKGYSSKGEQRGLGLYHVKKICIANNIDIICGNRDFNGINWIVFELYIRK
jgi:sensor histidine kinase regulating citrate/malate metabolism